MGCSTENQFYVNGVMLLMFHDVLQTNSSIMNFISNYLNTLKEGLHPGDFVIEA